jgi:hypothetical protein
MGRKTSLALTALLLAALCTAVPAHAGPTWEYGEASWMKLDMLGQIHYSFLDGAVDEDDFFIRRFRILVNGQIMEGVKVFAQTDYTNAGKNGADPKFSLLDGWVDVQLFGSDHWVKGGLIPLPFSFENSSAVTALLGIDYNTEILKLTNDSAWRDVGLAFHGSFADRIGYRAGIFDGYETSDKNGDAALRFTGRVDVAVIGDVPTGWFYVQDTGGGPYLTVGGGYDKQNEATLVTPELLDPAAAAAVESIPVDSEAWVLDFRSGFNLGGAAHLTVNGAWYDWDSSEFRGSTAFVEAGLRYHKTIGTLKYSLQDPEGGEKTKDYTAGLHYNLKGNNIKGGVEYRWGDSADWWLVGVQFLL